ncbi:MAG: hypothetical protein GQ564_22665, partial [Bacteroidales bacterium]|nr:hypothetical protein [Bacteroidales bacterium]
PINVVEIDSNIVRNYQTNGLYIQVPSSNCKISNNYIENIKYFGIYLAGSNGILSNNTVQGVTAGSGINIVASGATISENRFLNILAGTGIIVNGANNLVANNFIQAEGIGIAKGISLQENGSGSQIVFNSINITGTDVANGIGLEVLGGNNYTVKNNIFANNGEGLAAKLDVSITGSDWDYNDFCSSGDEFGFYLGTLYSDLFSWGSAINADANSNVLNSFYLSEIELRPSQRSLNGAGISSSGITLDIDGELRNQSAPDVGADEYLVDFGITQLLSPTLNCGLTSSDSITVVIRQFGDVPFIDLRVAYQVNGGPIDIDTVPGQLSNDIEYTFNSNQDLSAHGTYNFKMWLIGSYDDNINNDTLNITRYSSDVPLVNFDFISNCAGSDIPFTGDASVGSGSITNYEWLFGDSDTAAVRNPVHAYDTSGIYKVTLRAYTDIGCYGDTTKNVDLLATPQLAFSADDACFGEEVSFINNSSIETGSLTYNWILGDGDNSTIESPTHQYIDAGKYLVELEVTASSGCSVTASDSVEMFSQLFANLSTSVDTAWLNITGGIEPYSISWENGKTDTIVNGLESGWHSVTITDANSCSIADSIEVIIPELQFTITGVAASCGTCPDGSASILITQGVAPFYYQWSNGSTTDSTVNLLPGMHFITVRDAYLNAKEDSVYIDGVNTLSITLNPTNISCNNSGDGTIDLNINGGVAPFTILWSNGALSEDIDNLPAGDYSVTVTDDSSISETASVTLTEPDLITVNSIIQAVTCDGSNDGNIALSLSGGTAPYNYLWSNGDANSSISNLTEGEYSVEITDINSCVATDTFIIQSSSTLDIAVTTYDVSCNGNCNGVATVTASGGQAPYTYSWSNGATGLFQFNLCPENYTVTVTDASGCTSDSIFTINEPGPITLTLTPQDVSCGGAADGAITTSISGGTSPYTFSWDNGDDTQNISGLVGDIYNLTATDANGCMEFDIALIDEPDEIVISSALFEPTCASNNDGVIDVTVSGGAYPYNFEWNNGASSEDISNLVAGIFDFKITDATGCSDSLSFELTEPEILSMVISSIDPACADETSGSALAVVSGGTAPYLFNWSNGATTSSNDNLLTGNYELTVTDINGCEITDSTELINPEPLAVILTAANPTCVGICNGSITTEVTGGIAPYSYSWSNGMSTANLSDLCEDSYELTVTDANGCSKVVSQELNWGTAITGTINISDVTCTGMCNGYAIAMGTGGDGSFTYQWSDGQNGSFRTNLCPDIYNVTITDGQGCELNLTDTVKAPEPILINGVTIDASCKGEANGSISLTVTGGTPEYTYQWNSGQTTRDLTDVIAGNYIVTVHDANGCNAVKNFSLTEPATSISATGTTTNINCFGNATGSINLTVNGGTAPYTYNWSNGSATQNIANLVAGTYSVTISDANACELIKEFTITEPDAAISATGITTDINCFGDTTGSVDLTVTGGTAPYSYNWSNGSTTQNIANLTVGTYSVTISDSNACELIKEFTIAEPAAAISATGTTTDINCFGDSTGSVNLTVIGGTAPYTYNWSNGSTTQNIANLTVGTYSVTISDSNACELIKEFTITEPDAAISATGTTTDINCFGDSTGSVNLTVIGGTAPYSYNWSNGSTTQNIANLVAGTYSVMIIDSNACELIKEFTIAEPAAAISATGTTTNINCFGNATGNIELAVNGGTAPYSYNWSNSSTTQNIANLVAETYSVTISDSNACELIKEFSIAEPDAAISITGTTTNANCLGEATGSIDLMVNGGTVPYSYNWSNGSTEQNQVDLTTGTYSVIVTDDKACSKMWEVIVQSESKATLSGTVSYSQGFIDSEDATVFLMDATESVHIEVATVRIQENGFFEFTDIPDGIYIIKVRLDNHGGDNQKYKGVIPSYYNNTHKWKDAEKIDLSCDDEKYIEMEMFENPSATKGNGEISGKVILKTTSGSKTNFSAIEDADVILIDNSTELPLAYASSNETEGYYEIIEIPEGDYSLYVDITGISQESTYQLTISDDIEYSNLDFEVDLINMEIYIVNNSVDIPDVSAEETELIVYPNPAKNFVTLHSDLFEEQNVETTLYSKTGAILKTQTFTNIDITNNEFEFYFPDISSGSYMIKIQVGKIIQFKNLIVVK